LLWDYLFTHNDPDRLKVLASMLSDKGYMFVKIYESEKKPNEIDKYWLHIEKVETQV